MPQLRPSTAHKADRLVVDSSTADPAVMVAGATGDNLLDAIASRRPEWMTDAACIGEPTSTFFPGKGERTDRALAICATCPAMTPCLDEAVADPTLDYGVRGGATVSARQAIRKNHQRADISVTA